jgi:hypothetical protein
MYSHVVFCHVKVIFDLVAAVFPDQRFIEELFFCIDYRINTVDLWLGFGPVEHL